MVYGLICEKPVCVGAMPFPARTRDVAIWL